MGLHVDVRVVAATHRDLRARVAEGTAESLLLAYPWPGNVRELAHLIERVVLLGTSAEVGVDELPARFSEHVQNAPTIDFGSEVLPIRELQRLYAAWAFDRCGGEKRRACEALGIDYKTLMRYLEPADRKPPPNAPQP